MIKVYVMSGCPDCDSLKPQLESSAEFEIVDIGTSVKKLKEFVRFRDAHPAFEGVKAAGSIGIPCFVLEDGAVTLNPEDVGLKSEGYAEGQTCALDGSGC